MADEQAERMATLRQLGMIDPEEIRRMEALWPKPKPASDYRPMLVAIALFLLLFTLELLAFAGLVWVVCLIVKAVFHVG